LQEQVAELAQLGDLADIDGQPCGGVDELARAQEAARQILLHLRRAVDELAARGRREDVGKNADQAARNSPKTSTGRISRQADRPAVCITTSSLSPIIRLKM
jgi:sRNA-binding protein